MKSVSFGLESLRAQHVTVPNGTIQSLDAEFHNQLPIGGTVAFRFDIFPYEYVMFRHGKSEYHFGCIQRGR